MEYAASLVSSGAGNVSPTVTISGSNTTLHGPTGIALDSAANIYVADLANSSGHPSITVFSAGSTGNAAPMAAISGSNTQLHSPLGIGVDSGGNVYVADSTSSNVPSVFMFPASAIAAGGVQNVAPAATIGGDQTLLLRYALIAVQP